MAMELMTAPSRVFPDSTIPTARLTLRAFSAVDVDATTEACADAQTQSWLPLPRPYTRRHAIEWCTRESELIRTTGRGLVRAITVEGQLVGCIDLKRVDWAARTAEIGYWAHPLFRQRGYMTEATTEFARWALADQQLARVELRVAVGNVASHRVALGSGFSREGVARQAGYTWSGQVDLVIYSLVEADLASGSHDDRYPPNA